MAQSNKRLVAVVGEAGSASFTFGTEFWALGEIILKPQHDISIDIIEVSDSRDRLAHLHEGKADLALVTDQVPTAMASRIRGIMTLWPDGAVSVNAEPTQLLVHEDIPDNVVYHITNAIFSHATLLRSAWATLGIASPSAATIGLQAPIHAGAHQFYMERRSGFDDTSSSESSRSGASTPLRRQKVDAATDANPVVRSDDTSDSDRAAPQKNQPSFQTIRPGQHSAPKRPGHEPTM